MKYLVPKKGQHRICPINCQSLFLEIIYNIIKGLGWYFIVQLHLLHLHFYTDSLQKLAEHRGWQHSSYLFHHERFRDTFPTEGTVNTTGSLSWPCTEPSSRWARVIGPQPTRTVTYHSGNRPQVHYVANCTSCSNSYLSRFLFRLRQGASSNTGE